MFSQLYKKIRLLRNRGKEPYSSLYKILGFYPDNIQYYQEAFTHKSLSKKIAEEGNKWCNNERLEFLGDAVLGAVVGHIVFEHFPNKKEGFLTNTRSKIVQRASLNRVAVELGLDKLVHSASKIVSHNSYLYGNAFEALIGAIYLDKGYDTCSHFIERVIFKRCIDIDKIAKKEVNFKSLLIEWAQKNRFEIVFDLLESFTDRDGSPVFQTSVVLQEKQIGVGIGYTKKESQQNAAKMVIKRLRTDHEFQQYISELKKREEDLLANQEIESLPEDISADLDEELPSDAV